MADNYVEILVKSRDEAKPDLDDLQARLEELKHTVAEARASVDDADAAAKLDKLEAKLIDLGHRTANPKISVSGAIRAEADIHMVEASLDNLNRKEDETESKSVFAGMAESLQEMASSVPLLGGLAKVAGPAGIPLIAAAIGAAATEAGGLLTGLTAAGAGLGALGVLAIPTFDAIKAGLGDSGKKLQDLPKPIRSMVGDIRLLKAGFDQMSKAIQPQVMKIFAEGLGIAAKLMPELGKFAGAAAPAVEGLLKMLSKDISGAGFTKFMGFLQKLSGPAITAIGKGVMGLAGNIAHLMEAFSKQDVINAITTAFHILGATIDVLVDIIKISMRVWDSFSGQVKTIIGVVGDFIGWVKTAINWLNGLSTAAALDAGKFYTAISNAISKVFTWFENLPSRIRSALGNLGSLLLQAGKDLIQGLINGIESAAGGLLHTVQRLAGDVSGAFKKVLGSFSPSKVFEQHGKDIVQGLINGIDGGSGGAQTAMKRLGMLGLPGSTGGVSGGSGAAQLRVQWGGAPAGGGLDAAIWKWMRDNVRIYGGGGPFSAQKALGLTWPRGA